MSYVSDFCSEANFPYHMRLQGIMVLVFVIFAQVFVFMNKTTMIPCRRIS